MQYAKRFWLDYDYEILVAGVRVDPMTFSDEEWRRYLLWRNGWTLTKKRGKPAGDQGGLFEAVRRK